jgi:hypothetical protein
MVETPPGLGLAVLSAPEPLHYVSLFSHTIGYDVVVSQLPLYFSHASRMFNHGPSVSHLSHI